MLRLGNAKTGMSLHTMAIVDRSTAHPTTSSAGEKLVVFLLALSSLTATFKALHTNAKVKTTVQMHTNHQLKSTVVRPFLLKERWTFWALRFLLRPKGLQLLAFNLRRKQLAGHELCARALPSLLVASPNFQGYATGQQSRAIKVSTPHSPVESTVGMSAALLSVKRSAAAKTRTTQFAKPTYSPLSSAMPKHLHLPFLSGRNQSSSGNGDQERQVLGVTGDSCWHRNLMPSTRRRPHLTSSMRTVPSDRPSPAVSSWAESESDGHLPPLRKVRVSDAELVHRARNASRESQRGRLLRVPSVMWDCKEISGFAMLSRRMGTAGEDFEVLTTGEVACEPSDIEPFLRPQTESDYNAAARDFLGDQFIYGAIVHEVQPRGFDNSDDESDFGEEIESEDFHLRDVSVRTACFARSRRFARNEEWCFLKHFRSNSVGSSRHFETHGSSASSTASVNIDDQTGYTVVMSSMPESELSAGKMASGRVSQLHGITAAYLVQPLPQTVGCRGPRVRVSFHATFTSSTNTPDGYADSQTVRTRLMTMARSLHRIPELVQQRQRRASQFGRSICCSSRFGQEYPHHQDSRCVACTKRLRMKILDAPTRRSKRCQICLYRACASCWSKRNVETISAHTTTMIVCSRCYENFGSSEYSHIQLT